jgi:predicted HTH transcriptional regulator
MRTAKVYDITRNYHGGDPQSEAANLDTQSRKRGNRLWIISIYFPDYDFTCWEIEKLTKLSHQTVSSRITELKKSGILVATGEKRPTNTGSMATVYCLAYYPKDMNILNYPLEEK